MNREAWYAYIESSPATPNQVGRIMRECDRLALVDRTERLAVCAVLLGLDDLGSTKELSQGKAGRLVNILLHTASRAELPDVTGEPQDADGDQIDGQGDDDAGISVAEAIRGIVLMAAMAVYGNDLQAKRANVGLDIEPLRTLGFSPARGVHNMNGLIGRLSRAHTRGGLSGDEQGRLSGADGRAARYLS